MPQLVPLTPRTPADVSVSISIRAASSSLPASGCLGHDWQDYISTGQVVQYDYYQPDPAFAVHPIIGSLVFLHDEHTVTMDSLGFRPTVGAIISYTVGQSGATTVAVQHPFHAPGPQVILDQTRPVAPWRPNSSWIKRPPHPTAWDHIMRDDDE